MKTVEVIAKINPDLLLLAKPLTALHADKHNARKHAKRDLEVLSKSLQQHGQQKPIVVLANGKVIAGNGTLEAAQKLGWTHLACVTFDSEDAARAAAFAIVDNRSAELSEWDYEALALGLKDLPPELLNEVGFAPYELEPLLAGIFKVADLSPEVFTHLEAAKTHTITLNDEQFALVEKARLKVDGLTGGKPTSTTDVVVAALQAFTGSAQ